MSGGKQRFGFLNNLFEIPLDFSGSGLERKEKVKQSSEQGKDEDEKDPGQFIGWFIFFVKNIKDHQNAEQG